ncbi:MAG: hypothetical protein ACFFBD_29605 [Candidatus Hodarchaeota archaeon]
MSVTTSDLTDLKPLLREVIEDCEPFIKQIELKIFCCTLNTKKELHSYIRKLPLGEDKKDRLIQVLENSTTSISWGDEDIETVILIFDNPSDALSLSKMALAGLFLHEMMHSVQRQRGLEDDLQRSMAFSLDFFNGLAEFIPKGHFSKEDVTAFLKSISQFAAFALKELYVNTELIRRGRSLELLEYYEALLGLKSNIKSTIQPPEFQKLYEKGKIVLETLSELELAINYTMSLLAVFIPFSKTNRVKNEGLKERAERIRNQITEQYFSALPEYMHEFLRLDDLYITTFAFNEAFHRKFFGNFFNTVLEFILGEDFSFYHMSKISELIDEIYQTNSPQRVEILSPLLKAAYYLFIVHGESGIQQDNCNLLQNLVSKTIPKEELEEFKEFMETEPDAEITDLLESTFFRLLVDLRQRLLEGDDEDLLIFCRALLLVLHVASHLKPVKQEYAELKELIYLILNHKRRLFYRVLFIGKTELLAKKVFFDPENLLTPPEFEELMFNLQFFGVIVDNDVFNLAVLFGQVLKMSMEKTPPDDPNFPTAAALACSAMASSTVKEADTREQALPILRSTLLAIGSSFRTVRKVAREFGAIFTSEEEPILDEETIEP